MSGKYSRYRIVIEYFGQNFVGWQRQDNGISVQQIIEDAIFAFTKEKAILYAAGRTDSGVHARGQVAHFDLTISLDPKKMMRSLNHFLRPHKVSIIDCLHASDDFHARFSAVKRHYEYIILNRSAGSVIDEGRVWHFCNKLNLQNMRLAAEHLVGNHDFSSFRAKDCQAHSPVKTIDKIEIVKEGDYIRLRFSAPSFLHHMVRNIVGTLVMVGDGKIQPDDMKNILEAKNRSAAGVTAPPEGLYFMKVDY